MESFAAHVDPNERTPETCYLGDPQMVNMSPVGEAHLGALHGWLSGAAR